MPTPELDAEKPLVICLLGPTASGKTELAIDMARAHNCELISVDSALVYRGLNIGAAKPDYPHHLIDIRDPSESYSAAEFATDAHALVQAITQRGKTPLLVGGTMFYFRAFLAGMAELPPSDAVIRGDIEAEAQHYGWPHLHGQLQLVDPEAAARIHPNHSQRLSRALEVYRVSGVPLSAWHQQARGEPGALDRYRIRQFALSPWERRVLHERIAQRFEAMLVAGLEDEVRALHTRDDLHPALPAVRAVGYRQLWEWLEGECSREEAVERAVAATRQLAKRQLTWLRKWRDLAWIYTDRDGFVTDKEGVELLEEGRKCTPMRQVSQYLAASPL